MATMLRLTNKSGKPVLVNMDLVIEIHPQGDNAQLFFVGNSGSRKVEESLTKIQDLISETCNNNKEVK